MPRWLTQKKAQTDALIVSSCRKYRGKHHWVRTAYYVAKTSWRDSNHRPIYALYRKVEGGRREALILNVLDLKMKAFFENHTVSSLIRVDDLSINLLYITIILESRFSVHSHQALYRWEGKSYKPPKGTLLTAIPIWVSLRNSTDV